MSNHPTFSRSLQEAREAVDRFGSRLVQVTVPVFNRPLLRYRRRARPSPERDPRTHCACCQRPIHPGRAGRTCRDCRDPV